MSCPRSCCGGNICCLVGDPCCKSLCCTALPPVGYLPFIPYYERSCRLYRGTRYARLPACERAGCKCEQFYGSGPCNGCRYCY